MPDWDEEEKNTIEYTEEDKSIGSSEMTFADLGDTTFATLGEQTFNTWLIMIYTLWNKETKGTINWDEENK